MQSILPVAQKIGEQITLFRNIRRGSVRRGSNRNKRGNHGKKPPDEQADNGWIHTHDGWASPVMAGMPGKTEAGMEKRTWDCGCGFHNGNRMGYSLSVTRLLGG
jgi:hypothetical protein